MTLSLRHTLKSERGASMSMALMTFLVCTMVASVTITAATAVLGRQRTIEEADTSYYNVTSAAKVFWDELADNNVSVTIKRSCEANRAAGNTGFVAVPDTWRMSLDDRGESYKQEGIDHKLALNRHRATVWQILSADLVLNGSNSDYDFEIAPSDVGFPLQENDSSPGPEDQEKSVVDYESFEITAGSLPIVSVTVHRDKKGDFRFVFEQKDASVSGEDADGEDGQFNRSFRATMLVKANINPPTFGSIHHRSDDSYTLLWDTKVTWERISMNVGGA